MGIGGVAVLALLAVCCGRWGVLADGAVDSCNDADSCDLCILRAMCVWVYCPKKEAYMCVSSHRLEKDYKVFNPENFPEYYLPYTLPLTPLKNSSFNAKTGVQLRPQQIRITARPGQTVPFSFAFRPAKDYPLDVYYLVDYSSSMSRFVKEMKEQGKNIYSTLTNLTNNVVMGIGSFIEKPAMPYSHEHKGSHTFKNIMPLTDATKTNFPKVLDSANLTGNFDNPEASLDALLQAMVCKSVIEWRENTRKLILLTTDDLYHSAGDGKMAGAYRRHDGECHMINNDYPSNASTLFDYPSVHLINHVASENHFTIIFVVPNRVRDDYNELSKAIKGSWVSELSNSDLDVTGQIRKIYTDITQSFKFSAQNVPKEVKLSFNPDCDKGDSRCNFRYREQVEVQGSLEVLSCPSAGELKRNIKIQATGTIDALDIELEFICNCNFALRKYPLDENSTFCQKNGTLKLGSCVCNEGRKGKTCECGTDQVGTEQDKCLNDPMLSKCNDRGTCSCGVCTCNDRYRYWGDNCECDNEDPACYLPGGELCSGNGTCSCGVCNCNENHSGVHCTTFCDPSQHKCKHPFSTEVCSGNNGKCKCGECKCSGYSVGKYCEQCPNCNHLNAYCGMLHDCVACYRNHGSGMCPDKCQKVIGVNVTVPIENVTGVDTETYKSLELSDWTECRTLEEGVACCALFKYRVDNKVVHVAVQNTPDCTEQDNILMIVGLSILGAVLIGLLTLLAWKLLTYLHDRREYERFQKEMSEADWADNDNPIYNTPTTTFRNPAYNE